MQVDAEARQTRNAEGRVGDARLTVLLARVWRQRRNDRFLDLDPVERASLEAGDPAVHPNRGRRAGDEQQVAAIAFGEGAEPAFEAAVARIGGRRDRRRIATL